MTQFAYYPGCSGHGSGVEYMRTTEQVFARLGHELHEIPDWNCCGASSAHAVSDYLALALPGLDLAKAEEMGLDVVAPCAACFNRLAHAAHELPHTPSLGGQPLPAFEGKITVRHPMRVLAEPEALEALRAALQQDLEGLPVVAYYGCLTVRPAEIVGVQGSEVEDPTPIDRILEVLGAEVRTWADKTTCCGAAQSVPNPDLTRRLTLPIVEAAREAGAEALVTGCPMCFLNLEVQQVQAHRTGAARGPLVPVFYFTELMALAMGMPRMKRIFRRHLIPVGEVLARRRLRWA